MIKIWRVRALHKKDVIRQFLNRDRGYGVYALGDLAEPHWSRCEFFGAFLPNQDTPESLTLRYNDFDPPLLVLFGNGDGIQATLPQVLDERDVYYTASDRLRLLLSPHFEVAGRYMWRMAFDPASTKPNYDTAHEHRIRPLRHDEGAARLAAFFAQHASKDNHFSPSQVADGAFFGAFEDGALVSVAGTHLVSDQESVAAVGNVYTRPEFRGRGYATLCTAATTRYLCERGIQTIALNVAQGNEAAIHIYERLGYRRHKAFWEGMAYRHRHS